MELTDRERVITAAIIEGGYRGDNLVLLVSRDAPSDSRIYLFEKIARSWGYYVEVMPYEGLTNVKGKNCLVDAIKKYYSHRLVVPRFFLGAKGKEGAPVRLFRVENSHILMLNQRKRIWEVVS